jgi:2-iminobutanoate/2-iminopropanoate deaminase
MSRTSLFAILLSLAMLPAAFGAERKVIHPKEFPQGRPFSPALLVDGTLYVSGLVGQDLSTGKAPEDFPAEVKLCLDNVGIVLREAGMSFSDVVSVQVYLTDMTLFKDMNGVYVKYFPEPRPARTTVGVTKLAGPYRMEITVTAKK